MKHDDKRAHVVIVGGGFGGINAAKQLLKNKSVRVTMIDKRNHHLFQPLLYQVATAGLRPADIAIPIRTVLAKFKNQTTYLASATGAQLQNNILQTDFRDFTYDYLILACGTQHSYFGHNQWEPFAPGLKTLEQAVEIRRRVFNAFEVAERETDVDRIKNLLTFVVIGAGPTGVELAGALSEVARFALNKEFRHIDPTYTRIILIEAGPRILPSFDPKIATSVKRSLETIGVQVWTNSMVSSISDSTVFINHERIRAATILWAAGVKPAKLATTLPVDRDRHGRIFVQPDLSLKNHSNVFVIGDMAHCKDHNDNPLPGVAAVAIQQGKSVAKTILADLAQRPRKPFSYIDKGQMATIGRGRAVVELGSLKTNGFLAWFLWLVVHIYYLIGFRNRLLVLIQWAFAYFTFKPGSRIIQDPDWRSADD